VRIRLDARATAIVGDAHRLRQAVDNLLDNALRHAPAASDVVVTTCREGGRALLSVEDAGPGLSSEEQIRVFDRFHRADLSRARDSGGLGLGLPIARAIVEAHHGEVSVRSTPGQGCRFAISVPAA
jgi:two-component system OmpR family sensor kinase